MNNILVRSFMVAVSLAVVQAQAATTVYQNNTTLVNGPAGVVLNLNNGDFVGNTITLDPSTSAYRAMVLFQFQFHATTPNTTLTGLQLDFSLYKNNGPLVAPTVNEPMDLIYNSTPFNFSTVFPSNPSGGDGSIVFNTADFGVNGITVPDQFTWTLSISGLAAGDQFGLVAFDPPTVGYDANYYWQNVSGNWETHTNSFAGANSFGVLVEAVPEPGTLSLAAFGGIALLAAIKRRRTK